MSELAESSVRSKSWPAKARWNASSGPIGKKAKSTPSMRTRPSNIAATLSLGPHPKVNFTKLIPSSPFFSVQPRRGVANYALPFDRIRLHQRGESRRGEMKRIDVVGLEPPL